MKALDLFCGLGGWSDGLAAEGFEVLGVEIEPHIAELYKHPVIVSDICELNPEDFKGYDLIVGSPPCRNFSKLTFAGRTFWKDPPDPWGKGLELVNEFLVFVRIARPKYWLMENVPYLVNYYRVEPRTTTYISKTMRRSFWGNYPAFLVPRDYSKGILSSGINRATGQPRSSTHNFTYVGKLRSWERSYIPAPVSRALGRAVKSALEPIPTPPMSLITNIADKEPT